MTPHHATLVLRTPAGDVLTIHLANLTQAHASTHLTDFGRATVLTLCGTVTELPLLLRDGGPFETVKVTVRIQDGLGDRAMTIAALPRIRVVDLSTAADEAPTVCITIMGVLAPPD